MEKLANLFHHNHHDSHSHEQQGKHNGKNGNKTPPEFQSNPVDATKIPCGAGVLDLCLLGKDQVGVCTYAKKEIEVYDMKRTKVIGLSATGFPQYLDKTNVGLVFTDLDTNSIFQATYSPSMPNEDKKDVEMVPKKKEKGDLKKKTGSSKSSEKDMKTGKKQTKEKTKVKEDEKMEVDAEDDAPEKGGKSNDDSETTGLNANKRDIKAESLVATGDWIPRGIHSTKNGDIIVCLWNGLRNEKSHGKVVKYSKAGKVVKEFDTHNHKPFFSCPMYITESKHEDICVSDWKRKSVIVVTQSSSKKFEYEGHKDQNDEEKQFDPRGLCVDSFNHIIVADYWYHRLHIIDDRGHFLRYIVYDNIRGPTGLCIDENNTLYVGELGGKCVSVTKYLK